MGKKNRNFAAVILIVVLAAISVFTIINNNQKTQVSLADSAKPETAEITSNADIKILKSEISEKAIFYPYKSGDTYMEVLAVKATDGSIRTALNTCQVCFASGRGYYKQVNDTLVCQNCGNIFGVDDVEKVKNGCNPVPILKENKTDDGKYISINKEFLEANKELFANWEK